MARFLTELAGAGEPLDACAVAAELAGDEARHAALCAAVCEALGGHPVLPAPAELRDAEGFLRAPMAERACATAITMLLVNETLSVGYVADLRARATNPAIRRVLDATLDDEGGHDRFGESYVRHALARFGPASLRDWRALVTTTLRPHLAQARVALASVPPARRALDAWPEPDLAALGLFSPERHALVFQATLTRVLEPRLRALELWPDA